MLLPRIPDSESRATKADSRATKAVLFAVLALGGGWDDLPAPREVAPGVYCIGSSARFGSANIGWVVLDDHVVLIGAPAPELVKRALAQAEAVTKKPVRRAVLTHVRSGEAEAFATLVDRQLEIVVAQQSAGRLRDLVRKQAGGPTALAAARIRDFDSRVELNGKGRRVDGLGVGRAAGPADSAVFVPDCGVLFAGELCGNGPRADLSSSDTRDWIAALERLERLPVQTVVPGFGSVGGAASLTRQRRLLRELRRQVGYLVAQGRPLDWIRSHVQIAPEWLLWMPYDHPAAADIEHVYRELTVPVAPFGDGPADRRGDRPRALALIGDRFHDPEHLEAGLRQTFDRTGVDATFAVDVRAHHQQLQLLATHLPWNRFYRRA
jgi:glyoxylase-like metal-dependent hydrolase (beta-lactamase superfamily II)